MAEEWETAESGWEAQPGELAPGELASAAVGGANRGIAGLFGLPVDTAENIYNLLAKAGPEAARLLFGGAERVPPELVQGTPGGSQTFVDLMERAGINTGNPRPDSPLARMAHTGGMIAGGSMVPGARVAPTAAAAAGGALAGEALGPEYIGLGAMAPAAAGQAVMSAKNAIASRAGPNLETFRQAGTTPSAGQVTDNTFLHGLENLATKFPGGAGTMKSFIENQQKQMGLRARTGVSAEDAGRAIETGIRGEGGFLERTQATWKGLESKMSSKIPQGYTSTPSATAQALDELTTPVKGAEATTSRLINPKLMDMQNDLRIDLQKGNGEIPFAALRDLRSRVGSMIDDSLVAGGPTGELKKVYAGLSKDIETAATQAGAGREFAMQNNYYRARMDRVESVLERVLGNKRQPEEIFKTIMPTDPDQANKLRATLRSLAPDQRQVVSEAVANRLGKASLGGQDEMGTIFSSEKFLTNWNRLSPGAKAQLFPDPPLRENMEKIAKAAANMREGKGVYANPSGTAGSFAAYAIYMSPFVALGNVMSGNPWTGTLAGAGASAGGAYLGSKMMTSPKVVEWLATPIKPGTPQEAAHLARLGVIYNQSSPEVKEELAKFVNSIPKPDKFPVMTGTRG